MTAKRKNRVIVGNSHLTVYPWTHPTTGAKRWRFGYREGGKIKTRTFKTKIAAETAATKILEEIPAGLAWTGLDAETRAFLAEVHRRTAPSDRPGVLAFLRSRDSSAEISTAVASFMAAKKSAAGEITPHLRNVETFLEKLALHFAGRKVSEIHTGELATWWTDQTAGRSSKTRSNSRANLVTFWRWCQLQGLAGADPITAAERLPNVHVGHGERRILTHGELCAILNCIAPEFRAWAVLGAFAGLRPEEIAPGLKKSAKRGLHCEEIDWQFSIIRLPACVSKGGRRPRIIPMSDALKAGLEWAGIGPGMKGATTLANPSQTHELARLGRDLFAGTWPKDALRHSYGSYRNALIRSLDQVSEEMGNSVAMLHKHYHNPQPQEAGEDWFALRPEKRSVNDPWKWTFESEHPPRQAAENPDISTKTA